MDKQLDTDDLATLKFQQAEIERNDDERNTMRKYLDVDEEEHFTPPPVMVGEPSTTRLTLVKIGMSVAIITAVFGAYIYFPQMFQLTTTPALNSLLMIGSLAFVVSIVLFIAFYL